MATWKGILIIASLVTCTACSQTVVQPAGESEHSKREAISTAADPLSLPKMLIAQHRFDLAKKLLTKIADQTPRGWKAFRENPKEIRASFHSEDEFLRYVAFHLRGKEAKKPVVWDRPSYSAAWYLLGFLEVQNRNIEGALPLIDKALALEPGNPTFLCEKAFALTLLGKYKESYEVALKATKSRGWSSDSQKSRAFRAVGYALIELKRLDEAETAYRAALKLDPKNPASLNEIRYIEQMRAKMGYREARLSPSMAQSDFSRASKGSRSE